MVSAGHTGTPTSFSLSAFPNPFNPATIIEFSAPTDGKATITVYDLLGREVEGLFAGEVKAGEVRRIAFNASGLTSGMYICRLDAGGRSVSKLLLLLK